LKIIYGSEIKNVYCLMKDKGDYEKVLMNLEKNQQTKNMKRPKILFCDTNAARLLSNFWDFWVILQKESKI
jgi:hypothetical protein